MTKVFLASSTGDGDMLRVARNMAEGFLYMGDQVLGVLRTAWGIQEDIWEVVDLQGDDVLLRKPQY